MKYKCPEEVRMQVGSLRYLREYLVEKIEEDGISVFETKTDLSIHS